MARTRKTVEGFVLRDGASTSSAPQTFGVFPGLWVEGVPVAIADLGLSDGESALELVEELGLPLDPVSSIEALGFEAVHGYPAAVGQEPIGHQAPAAEDAADEPAAETEPAAEAEAVT